MSELSLNVHARDDPSVAVDVREDTKNISIGTSDGSGSYGISAETPAPVAVSVSVKDSGVLRITAGRSIALENRDYNKLANRPKIEGVMLVGDKSFEELHMNLITNAELETMLV